MVDNRRKGCRFSYLDNAIFQPSKIKLVLATHRNHRYHYSGQVSVVFHKISTSLSPTVVIRPGPWIHLRTVIHGHHKIAQENKTQ